MYRLSSASKVLQTILASREGRPASLSRTRLFSTSSAPSATFASPSSQQEKRRWSAILLFIPGLATFGLGTWQLYRREWKVELLEYRRKRLEEDIIPLDLALAASESSDQDASRKDVLHSLEFRRVQCEGIYAEDKSIYLGPRGRSSHGVTERGYFLVTPLLPLQDEGGSVQVPVLVNRGWVPGSWRSGSPKGPETNPKEEAPCHKEKTGKSLFNFLWGKKQETSEDINSKVNISKVVGVIRGSENPSMFVPSNEPESGQWFYVDIPAMARAVNLPEGVIYIEALREKTDDFQMKQYPDPKDLDALIHSSVMPQDHLNYTFTWYTLSAATTFMAWKRLNMRVSRRI